MLWSILRLLGDVSGVVSWGVLTVSYWLDIRATHARVRRE